MEKRTAFFELDDLEVRAKSGNRVISGAFKYGRTAVLSAGGLSGKPLKEKMGPDAFGYTIRSTKDDISLLSGHSFDRILASRKNRSLKLSSDKKQVSFRAEISPEIEELGYVRDTLGQINAGLITGISPGFRIPPARAVKEPVKETEEPVNEKKGQHGATILTIRAAILYELSLVARPAYASASEIEARELEMMQHIGASARSATVASRYRLTRL